MKQCVGVGCSATLPGRTGRYKGNDLRRKYCSDGCREHTRYEAEAGHRKKRPVLLDTTTRGAQSELSVAIDLLERGYMVFRNITPSGSIDIIAVERGEAGSMLRIEVKTSADNSKYKTFGKRKYKQGKHYDYLAIANYEGDIMYHPDLPEIEQ